MIVEFKAFGPGKAGLVGDPPARNRLTQPRPLALLAYLVLARPQGPHSRDSLIALLWPESDHPAGRQGLRNALHRIRAALRPELIVATGETLVAVDEARLRCDALDFRRAIEGERWDDALTLYSGELLRGFHVGGAPDFERWLDSERARMHQAALSAARTLAEVRTREGNLQGALAAAWLACDLSPEDEGPLRDLVELLVAVGDRASALRAYDHFRERLLDELGIEPSGATEALIRTIREGGGPHELPSTLGTPVGEQPSPRPGHRPTAPRRSFVAPGLVAAGLLGAGLATVSFMRSPAPPDTTHVSAYLAARAMLDDAEVPAARMAFERLVDQAPLFAPGWAGLSVALYRSGFDDIPPEQAMPRALAAAERARALEPSVPDAIETQIAYDLFHRWDLAGARQRLDSALQVHPEAPEFHNLLATWYRFRGQLDSALAVKRRNAERDPLSSRYAYQVGQSLYFAHRCPEAEVAYRRLPVELRTSRGRTALYRALACQGRNVDAAEVLREDARARGDSLGARLLEPPLSPERMAQGIEAIFRARLATELERRRESWSPPERIMLQYAEMRNADSTLTWLDSMRAERSMMLYVVPFDPLHDFMRDDPRFQAFVARLPWIEAPDPGR